MICEWKRRGMCVHTFASTHIINNQMRICTSTFIKRGSHIFKTLEQENIIQIYTYLYSILCMKYEEMNGSLLWLILEMYWIWINNVSC